MESKKEDMLNVRKHETQSFVEEGVQNVNYVLGIFQMKHGHKFNSSAVTEDAKPDTDGQYL